MYIHGSFINEKGDTIALYILTNRDRTSELEIGTDEGGVWFTGDGIEITDEGNDTFDHLLRHSATIHLLCSNLVGDFYCKSCRDAVVNIYVNSSCVFAGYLEPLTYSQPYNETLDEVELTCVDCLSAIQYSRYKEVGSATITYTAAKAAATQRTFMDILTEIGAGITSSLDILGTQTIRLYFDGSKSIDDTDANHWNVFSKIAIADLLFFGDEEDDVWQQDAVVEEIMRYLNLHIVQTGFSFYIFSWETVKTAADITWHDLTDGTSGETTAVATTTLTNDIVADTRTTIEMTEVYNQLLLTDDIKKTESLIESPLDDDSLSSPYRNKQKFMTEYSSEGEGKKAYRAIYAMAHGESTDYGSSSITDWYLQVKKARNWQFPIGGDTTADDIFDIYCKDGANQHYLLQWLGKNTGASIISFGKVEINNAKQDNSLVSSVSMTDYMVISVNGNETDNDETNTLPSADSIRKTVPVAVYTGNSAGGVFSPADSETTNYIVISGKMVLNPIMHTSGIIEDNGRAREATFKEMASNTWAAQGITGIADLLSGKVGVKTVPSRDNKDGRFYLRRWWKAGRPQDDVEQNDEGDDSLYPFTDDGPEQYEFKYSAVGDDEKTDTISKVSVLQCMLVIGSKCVVEKTPGNDLGTGVAYTGEGLPQDFVWLDYKERADCQDDDEYYAQSFSIGFNPKIGDKLVGTEFDIQNNHDYTMNVDEEGIAIPIKTADRVSGVVRFQILGIVNLTWDEITRRHGSFWRHTKWASTSVPLMAHVSSVFIKEFEMKVYSDEGLMSGTGKTDNDVVYMSDTDESYVNRKDDLTFRFTTTLTAAEAAQLGVGNDIKLSAPIDMDTETGLLTIYDRNKAAQAKPEQIYVDSYYQECHLPRVVMKQNVEDTANAISPFAHWRHEALSKDFYTLGIGLNLGQGTAQLRLKETW